jgi:hypothetical protein
VGNYDPESRLGEVRHHEKNRIHVVWLFEGFGVKQLFMGNSKKWIVLPRRIGLKLNEFFVMQGRLSLVPYCREKDTNVVASCPMCVDRFLRS